MIVSEDMFLSYDLRGFLGPASCIDACEHAGRLGWTAWRTVEYWHDLARTWGERV